MLRLFISILLFLPGTLPGAFAQGERVALVVGVASYLHAPKLINTIHDAEDMGAALGKLGFKVDLVLDPDRAALEAAVRRFGQRSVGAEASVFHYSGHAMEFGGRNWLVPTGADFDTGRNVRFEALDLDSVLEQTDGNTRVTVVFLDACRDNPFLSRLSSRTREVASRGLARIDSAASGVLVAFATAPGQVAQDGQGRNSPFTSAILRQIDTPGLEIKSLMTQVTREVVETTGGRQRPWQNSSLQGDFYFKAALAPPRVEPRAAPPVQVQMDAETLFWNSIAASADAADFRAYLSRFPDGVFAELARNRLNRQQVAATPANTRANALPAGAQSPPEPRSSAPAPAGAQTTQGRLVASLSLAAPGIAEPGRERIVQDYLRDNAPKALAFAPGAGVTWRATGRADVEAARTAALEGCQVHAGRPCTLLAVNDTIESNPSGAWPLRDMQRVNYSGKFDAARIPAASADLARSAEVAGYLSAVGPKAAAFHPSGRVHVATGATGQAEAEVAALAACNASPARAATGGACYLYATGVQVVLSQRLTKSRPAPTNLAEAFAYLNLSSESLRIYSGSEGFKAYAIEPASRRMFRYSNVETAARAEQLALEGCQMQYGAPCVLLALGDELRAADPAKGLPRSMPRVMYDGPYKPEQVPSFKDSKRKEFLEYQKLPQPKAMAIRANNSRVAIASGKSALEAQTKALDACNEPDPAFPCFIYAIDNKVVFAKRRPDVIR